MGADVVLSSHAEFPHGGGGVNYYPREVKKDVFSIAEVVDNRPPGNRNDAFLLKKKRVSRKVRGAVNYYPRIEKTSFLKNRFFGG